jgi:hypothetical protein
MFILSLVAAAQERTRLGGETEADAEPSVRRRRRRNAEFIARTRFIEGIRVTPALVRAARLRRAQRVDPESMKSANAGECDTGVSGNARRNYRHIPVPIIALQ